MAKIANKTNFSTVVSHRSNLTTADLKLCNLHCLYFRKYYYMNELSSLLSKKRSTFAISARYFKNASDSAF